MFNKKLIEMQPNVKIVPLLGVYEFHYIDYFTFDHTFYHTFDHTEIF